MLRAVKAAVPCLGVIYRLSVEDFFPGGLPYGEGRQIAIWAAQAGADALHVTAGHYRSLPSAAIVIPPMTMPDGPFLDFAADVKKEITVPVIAVGRLGDPALATAAVASGKADFIALGRTLDRRSAMGREARARRADPPLPRLQHLHRRDARRRAASAASSTARPAAKRMFADAKPPRGERIAVIGAGPAGLTYASLVADGNTVTVFEKAHDAPAARSATPARRRCSRRSRRTDASFARYIDDMVAACETQGRRVPLRHRRDRATRPAGAVRSHRDRDRRGLSLRPRPAGHGLLDRGAGHWPGVARIMTNAKVRDWFYYRARHADRRPLHPAARPGQTSS